MNDEEWEQLLRPPTLPAAMSHWEFEPDDAKAWRWVRTDGLVVRAYRLGAWGVYHDSESRVPTTIGDERSWTCPQEAMEMADRRFPL